MTMYAYSCNGLLFIGAVERKIPREEAEYWSLIAAWPGTLEDMPDSIRPVLQELYDRA